jgi:hypothetical protein
VRGVLLVSALRPWEMTRPLLEENREGVYPLQYTCRLREIDTRINNVIL